MELQGEFKLRADSRTKSGTDKTKSKLLKRINNSPGIRYRELLRATGFSNGVMAYHLKKLENSKRIKVSRISSEEYKVLPFEHSRSRITCHRVHKTQDCQTNRAVLTSR